MRTHTLFSLAGALAAVARTPLIQAVPTSHGDKGVAHEWDTCGGHGWKGPTKCAKGLVCTKQSEWYSSCRKTDETGCGNAEWDGCGGRGWTGDTCCQKGLACTAESEWWSACKRVSSTLDPSSDPTCEPTTVTVTKTVDPSSSPVATGPSSQNPSNPSSVPGGGPSSSVPGGPSSTVSGGPSSTLPSGTAGVRPSVTRKPSELRLSPDWDVYAPPQRREYNFEIAAAPGSPDVNRTILAVNGQFPGPLIEVNAGDTVVVNIKNSLDFQIAVHWHGIQQNGTIWEDGPSGVTQCPIGAGVSYTYEFKIVGREPYGTLWWHAHRSAYYADGIVGPLIVHSPEDPLRIGCDYDIDQIVLFSDWYHTASDVIVGALNTPEGFEGTAVAPSPQSGLLNGYGTYNCSNAAADEPCFQNTQLQELVFPPDSLIRLRFIHAGAHPVTFFSVDEHELAVIEADDTPTHPLNVHRIPVNVAQRYSAILNTTGHQVGDTFYLRSQINTGCLGAPFPDLDPQTLIVIRIANEDDGNGFTDARPNTVDWNDATNGTCVDLDESQLVPIIERDAPSTITQISAFNSSFAVTDIFRWTLNGVSFENFAYNPLLLQVWRGETINPGRAAIITAGLESMDLIINNVQGADHPFHLHNLRFWVMGRGQGVLNATTAATLTFNTTNPIRRDTIGVSPGTWVVLRLITDIPGVHAFHCHILFHQAVGLLGAIVVQPEVVRQFDIPQRNLDLCIGGNTSIIDPGRKRSLPPTLDSKPFDAAVPAAPVQTGVAKVKAKKSGGAFGLW
ncbi:hypothetical protein JCM10213v2_005136 [Rhodosporidiobolus nylandii]